MKPKDIFQLAVRLLGLYFLYQGISGLPGIFGLIISGAIIGSLINILMIIWPLIVGWWLIGGAPQLCERAYPESNENEG